MWEWTAGSLHFEGNIEHQQWNAYITLLNQYDSTLETQLFV